MQALAQGPPPPEQAAEARIVKYPAGVGDGEGWLVVSLLTPEEAFRRGVERICEDCGGAEQREQD